MRIPNLDTGNAVTFSNANNVVFGTAGQTITAAANGLVAVPGVTNYGANQTLVFSNSNNVTFGMSGSSRITASFSLFADPTISAGTQSVRTANTIVFSNSNGITFGIDGGAHTVTAAIAQPLFYASPLNNTAFSTTGDRSLFVFPLCPSGPFSGLMNASTFMIDMSCSATQSTSSGSFNFSLGIYTLNSTRLSLLNSASTQLTWTGNAGAISSNFLGRRWLTFNSSQFSSTPVLFTGTDYWLGFICRSSNATQGFSYFINKFGLGQAGLTGTVGVSATGALTAAKDIPFFGYYSAQTAALPTTIGAADLSNGTDFAGRIGLPYVFLNNFLSTF